MADNSSDIGAQDLFRGPAAAAAQGYGPAAAHGPGPIGSETRGARTLFTGEQATAAGWGKGPVVPDNRKYRYDRMRALSATPVAFEVTKADRLDAREAGDVLHNIHVLLGIDREDEARLAAFDAALWWQHTINGASMMQEGRGSITVDSMEFDISDCLKMIGVDRLRKFFRAYADDILEVNLDVIRKYSPYDPVASEKYGQLQQVAVARGLQKYPQLAFDAADAANYLTPEMRRALYISKMNVIPVVNTTDRMFPLGTGRVQEVVDN